MRKALLLFIRGYQLILRPYLGSNCRFYPSCSCYAMDAIRSHGSARGALLAVKRICSCHPWNDGGYDPVPDATPTDNLTSTTRRAS